MCSYLPSHVSPSFPHHSVAFPVSLVFRLSIFLLAVTSMPFLYPSISPLLIPILIFERELCRLFLKENTSRSATGTLLRFHNNNNNNKIIYVYTTHAHIYICIYTLLLTSRMRTLRILRIKYLSLIYRFVKIIQYINIFLSVLKILLTPFIFSCFSKKKSHE